MDKDMEEIDFAWFAGGRLNACYNCVDRHLATQGDPRSTVRRPRRGYA
jgi:acetyl-CoA synthetase